MRSLPPGYSEQNARKINRTITSSKVKLLIILLLFFPTQYNCSRAVRVSQQVWVLEMVDISRSRRVGNMEIIDSREVQTILPISHQHVRPSTTIHTDQWAAYNQLQNIGLYHHTVNHSINFVDPVTKVHTQNTESHWGRKKIKLKRMRGTTKDICQATWTRRCGERDLATKLTSTSYSTLLNSIN